MPTKMKRREFLGWSLSAAFAPICAAQNSYPSGETGRGANVIVIGGGFGGATCARYLKQLDSDLRVTLIESKNIYITCPMSNAVIAGIRPLDSLTVGYRRLREQGIKIVTGMATAVDASSREVRLSSGEILSFDRLVMSPGIELVYNTPEGYDRAASHLMPHAWKAGNQTVQLARKIRWMKDGGTVLIAVPPAPYRCPPGPFERASLIASYLKTEKPKSKVLILDANEKFSKQELFEEAWKSLYGDMIERIPLSQDGKVVRIDIKKMKVYTELAEHSPTVANIIPLQRAAQIAVDAGLTDATGWCPINPQTHESTRVSGIHVIGDACVAEPMPKSASAANSQAKVCASAIVSSLKGIPVQDPMFHNTCYSLVSAEYGISITGNYHLERGATVGLSSVGGISPVNAPLEQRQREARYAKGWYSSIVADSFG
jgi:sulfide dehydrogenase [flavocytochrome c] flavoprotein subunit